MQRSNLPQQPQAPQWALAEGGWLLTDGLGHRLALTSSEHSFLGRLFLDRGKTVDRRAIIEAPGGDVVDFNYSHLDTIASRLHKRAERRGIVLPLHAVRGQGFTFAE